MTLPGQSFSILNNKVGLREVVGGLTVCVLGVSSAGALGLQTFSRLTDAKAEYEQGPLSEDVCTLLATVGGPVQCYKASRGVAGSIGSVTKAAAGGATGTVSASVTPASFLQAWQIDDPSGTPSYVDETADLASSATSDVTPFPASEAVGDQFVMGFDNPFNAVEFTLGTNGNGGTITVKYWDGSAWTAVSGLSDGTSHLTGDGTLSFTMPTDWVKRSINGSDSLYFLALEIATVYSTTNPVISQAQITDQGPHDAYDVIVEITTTGTLGAGEFRYTLDGGKAYSDPIVIPSGGTYDLENTGIRLTFSAGGGPTYFQDGDTHTFSTTGPYVSTATLSAAITDLLTKSEHYDLLLISGAPADASTAASIFAALNTHGASLEAAFKFRRILTDAGSEDTAANVKSSFAAQTSDRVHAIYGKTRITSAKPFVGYSEPWRDPAVLTAMMQVAVGLSGDPKRPDRGGIPGVTELAHNEATATTTLDDARISTLRTWDGRAGFYLTQARLKSAVGSDFRLLPHGTVMDRACKVVYEQQQLFVGRNPRTYSNAASKPAGEPKAPGTIYGPDAKQLEQLVNVPLASELLAPKNADGVNGHVSDLLYEIDRARNIKTDGTIGSDLQLVSLAYIDFVATTLSYAFALESAAA